MAQDSGRNIKKDRKTEGFSMIDDIFSNQPLMIGIIIALIALIVIVIMMMNNKGGSMGFSETSPGPVLTNTPTA